MVDTDLCNLIKIALLLLYSHKSSCFFFGHCSKMDNPTLYNSSIDYCSSPNRRKSTSYLAVKEALYQLTCLNDFICEDLGAGFFADVYKVSRSQLWLCVCVLYVVWFAGSAQNHW